ncbi:hypothetical protein GWI33_005261 [Rhynchophorus ferrugineus]|uniref:Uncharacterized protein n=1 Tax=Rhynchophorus ferrugineus TaxID=354439 RepID=A0A834MJQ3_RHYFE|nr:hypothetical protein GWI33_005261 [Rhynchophorus ferrugineus]
MSTTEGGAGRGEYGETPGRSRREGGTRAAGGNRAVTSRKTATVDCLVRRRSRLAGDVTLLCNSRAQNTYTHVLFPHRTLHPSHELLTALSTHISTITD